jgi:biopolymer transport protein ExbD
MNALTRKLGERHEEEQDFELNIASIIDCFTVVICYLLLSASFISIGAFDVGTASTGPGSKSAPPEVTVSVRLREGKSSVIRVSGRENQVFQVPAKEGVWDYAGISARLAEVKGRWASLNSVIVATDGDVEYQTLVKAVESAKMAIPVVFIGEEHGAGVTL